MSLLEAYNSYYEEQLKKLGQISFNSNNSLELFVQNDLIPRLCNHNLLSDLDVIELGAGDISYFYNTPVKTLSLVDFSSTSCELLKTRYPKSCVFQLDLCNSNLEINSYDVALDSHCLHFIEIEKRQTYLNNIYNSLKQEGIFCGEFIISKNDYSYSKKYRFINSLRNFEEELISLGFKIRYFYVSKSQEFVLGDGEYCDVVKVMAQK